MSNIEIINKFIEICGYTYENEEVLGVLFYGSRNNNTNKSYSDIDLLIVTNKSHNYKGVKYIDNIKVEYFEKNIYSLFDELDNLEYDTDRSLVSIFTNGTIIFSKNNTLELLKEEVMSKNDYSRRNKTLESFSIYPWLEALNNLDKNNLFFEFIYHNLLEKIRKAYHAQHGYSKIPDTKTIELYSDTDYASEFYCINLPSKDFINEFLELVREYDVDKLNDLLSKIKYNEGQFADSKRINTNILNYRSTIIANGLIKIMNTFNMDSYKHYYYIVLEKIRSLYCDMYKIDSNINYFGSEYDKEFINLFTLCLRDMMKEDITSLFEYVTKSVNIDYHNYNILDIKL